MWADVVFVMEPKHADVLRQRFDYRDARCLHIPDDYRYMDPELIELLEAAVDDFLTSGNAPVD